MIKIGFIGSSKNYNDESLKFILDIIFEVFDDVLIVNGGYRGTMEFIPNYAKNIVSSKSNKTLKVQGVLFDGYANDPNQSHENSPNEYNDVIFSTKNIGERANSIIELVDILFVLPGRTGTLHELLQSIETIRYNMNYHEIDVNLNRLFLDEFWKPHFLYLEEKDLINEAVFKFIRDNCFYKNYKSSGSKKVFKNQKNKESIISRLNKVKTLKKSEENFEVVNRRKYNFKNILTKKEVEDKEILTLFKRLNKSLASNYVDIEVQNIAGIDIAVSKKTLTTNNLYSLNSIGNTRYLYLLNSFLNEYKSINLLNKNKSKWYSIDNNNLVRSNDYYFIDHLEDNHIIPDGLKEGNVQDWLDFQKIGELGSDVFIFSSIINHPSDINQEYTISCFITFQCNLTKILKSNVENIVSNFLLNNTFKHVIKDVTYELQKKSLKSSLSAVMARNMSHNIGSHVLSRVVDIQSLKAEELIKDCQYQGLFNRKNKVIHENIEDSIAKQTTKKKENLGVVNNTELEKLVKQNIQQQEADKRLVVFNAYLRTRQDFLADIVSVTPQIQNTKKLVGDLLKEFDSNRILLNRISGIDEFEFTIKADIKIDNDIKEDIEVAISNDLIGQHAFYIITENIIRNTAKHSKKSDGSDEGKENNPIEFTIRVRESELDSSLYSITIFDSIMYEDKEVITIEQEDYDKHKVEYDEWCEDCNDSRKQIKRIDKLITDQNIRINKKILTDNYELRTDALGLIEMQACASYLRQIDLEDIPKYKLEFEKESRNTIKEDIRTGNEIHRILRAVNPKNEESKNEKDDKLNVLGYRFYLPKPKELLIIDTTGDFFDNIKEEVNIKDFESKGVLLIDARKEKKIEDKKYHFNENRIYPHEQMLIWRGEDSSVKIEDFSFLPKRYIFKDDFEKIFKLCNKEDFSLEEYITKPKELNTEVLRAIVRKKADEKKVYSNTFKHISKKLRNKEVINDNKYILEIADHGVGNINKNHFSDIYNSATRKYSLLREIKGYVYKEDDQGNEVKVNIKDWDIDKHLKYLNSSLNNVLILDERIQEKAYNTYKIEGGEEKSYREIWDYVNVVIPIKGHVDLLAKNYDSDYLEAIKKIIRNEFLEGNRICKSLDYVVIHLGVIEKLLSAQDKNKDDNNERKKLIESLFSDLEVKPKIVITSGRAPRDLPKEYSFISFSTCSNALIETRSKYLLNEVLNSSRPKINI